MAAVHAMRTKVAATLDEVWVEPVGRGLDPQVGGRVYQNLCVVGLYRTDLADGVADATAAEATAAVAALSALSERPRRVDPHGLLPPAPATRASSGCGIATAALADAQDALDSVGRAGQGR